MYLIIKTQKTIVRLSLEAHHTCERMKIVIKKWEQVKLVILEDKAVLDFMEAHTTTMLVDPNHKMRESYKSVDQLKKERSKVTPQLEKSWHY